MALVVLTSTRVLPRGSAPEAAGIGQRAWLAIDCTTSPRLERRLQVQAQPVVTRVQAFLSTVRPAREWPSGDRVVDEAGNVGDSGWRR